MARLGLDSGRSELPGSPLNSVVTVRWLQRGFNSWRAFTNSAMAALREDGVWGSQTAAGINAIMSQIDPSAMSSVRPLEGNRAAIISKKLEGYLASLDMVQGSMVLPIPVVDPAQSTADALASGPDPSIGLSVYSEPTPGWVYAIAGVSFFAAAGLVYAALNTK